MTDADMSCTNPPKGTQGNRPTFSIEDGNGVIGEEGTIYLQMNFDHGLEPHMIGQYNHLEEAVIALKAVKTALMVTEHRRALAADGVSAKYVSVPSYQGEGGVSSHLDARSHFSQSVASRPVVDPADSHCNESRKEAMTVFEGNEAQVAMHNRKLFAISMMGDTAWEDCLEKRDGHRRIADEYLHGDLTFEELKQELLKLQGGPAERPAEFGVG